MLDDKSHNVGDVPVINKHLVVGFSFWFEVTGVVIDYTLILTATGPTVKYILM